MDRLTKDCKILYKGEGWKLAFGDMANPEAKIIAENINTAMIKLSSLEDLFEKYNIENIKELEKILKIFFMKK